MENDDARCENEKAFEKFFYNMENKVDNFFIVMRR